jgi:hypothetical protein
MFPDIARDDVFHLETSRLWLRWPRVKDAAAIERYSSRWEVARMTARIPHPYPPGEAERFIFAARQANAARLCFGAGGLGQGLRHGSGARDHRCELPVDQRRRNPRQRPR